MMYGVYGVSLASTGLLSALAFTLATDAYGPVADNAGGIAESKTLFVVYMVYSVTT
jgi:Na+/H+-translocating membrane pyrophosphatase